MRRNRAGTSPAGQAWKIPGGVAFSSEGVRTVPAERMKANRRHRAPLCGRALEILEVAWTLGEGVGPLVFTRV